MVSKLPLSFSFFVRSKFPLSDYATLGISDPSLQLLQICPSIVALAFGLCMVSYLHGILFGFLSLKKGLESCLVGPSPVLVDTV